MEPKGNRPPNRVITSGSVYHFFSGIGLGTALIRHGKFDCPFRARPNNVPIKLHGNIMNVQMARIANFEKKNLIFSHLIQHLQRKEFVFKNYH